MFGCVLSSLLGWFRFGIEMVLPEYKRFIVTVYDVWRWYLAQLERVTPQLHTDSQKSVIACAQSLFCLLQSTLLVMFSWLGKKLVPVSVYYCVRLRRQGLTWKIELTSEDGPGCAVGLDVRPVMVFHSSQKRNTKATCCCWPFVNDFHQM